MKKQKYAAVLFSYNRKSMLLESLKPFRQSQTIIIDDGSDFTIDHPNFIKVSHSGKQGFWNNWFLAFDMLNQVDTDLFIFTADDLLNVDVKRILDLHKKWKKIPYACNLQFDGRTQNWTDFTQKKIAEDMLQVGFVDCLFFCNRLALESIGWHMEPVPPSWFNRHSSSGVGRQLSFRMLNAGVNMYLPLKSIGYHGDHESVMHPQERKKNPLISKM